MGGLTFAPCLMMARVCDRFCSAKKQKQMSSSLNIASETVVARPAVSSKEPAPLPVGFDSEGLDRAALGGRCMTFCGGLGQDARKFAKYSITQLKPALHTLISGGSVAHANTMRLYAQLLAGLASGHADVSKPSPEVHLVWISHLLRSAHYQIICSECFGCFIDHDLAAVDSLANWEAFKAELKSKQGKVHVPAGAEEQFYKSVIALLPMNVLEGDVEFFKGLQESFRGEMRLGFLGNWLESPCSTVQRSLTALDTLLERHYYTHLLVASRLKACGHPGINPVFHVDWLWHAHLIYPSKYYQACVDAFGDVVHHTPGPILEDSRPFWRTLFDRTPAEEITELLQPLQKDRQLKVITPGGDTLVTLKLQGHEPLVGIKKMIAEAGGPAAGFQQLVQSNGAMFDNGIVSDIPLETWLTVVRQTRKVNVTTEGYGSPKEVTVELAGSETEADIKAMLREAVDAPRHYALDNSVLQALEGAPVSEAVTVMFYDTTCG